MTIIVGLIGLDYFVAITMILLIVGGLTKRTKCWSSREALYGSLPYLLIIILFSIVLLMTTPSVLELLGVAGSTANNLFSELQTSISNAFNMMWTTTATGSTLAWYYIYLPFYIGGAIAFILGDELDMKLVKVLGTLLVFLPILFQIVVSFTAWLPGWSNGLLSQYITIVPTGNYLIDGFTKLANSVLDWMIVALIVSVEKLAPERPA